MDIFAYSSVFQLSLKKGLDIKEHLQLGEALSQLRRENILIVGSGQSTHNLNEISRGGSCRFHRGAFDFETGSTTSLRTHRTPPKTERTDFWRPQRSPRFTRLTPALSTSYRLL